MMKRMLAVVAVLLGTLAIGLVTAPTTVAGAAGPTTTTIYDSTDAGASSLVSQCFDCEQMSQIGNQISFAPGTSRIFVRFLDVAGNSHGSSSVAVQAE